MLTQRAVSVSFAIPFAYSSGVEGLWSEYHLSKNYQTHVEMFPEPALQHSTAQPNMVQMTPVPPVPNIPQNLSRWLSSMDRLARAIDRLHEIAARSGSANGPQLFKKVDILRKAFEKQQGLGDQFLRLTEEYTTRYQWDISAEIQQQRSFQETLGAQEKLAKELYSLAVDLQRSFQNGIVNAVKNLQKISKVTFCRKDQY